MRSSSAQWGKFTAVEGRQCLAGDESKNTMMVGSKLEEKSKGTHESNRRQVRLRRTHGRQPRSSALDGHLDVGLVPALLSAAICLDLAV